MASESISGIPQPGDVYREYFYHFPGWPGVDYAPSRPQLDPRANSITAQDLRRGMRIEQPLYLVIPDLDGATRAELILEYWGGHIGSSFTGFRVNGSEYLPVPMPANTPTAPEAYYKTYMGNPAAPFPLELLKAGVNEFRFGCGPQVAHSFDCGFYWVYCFGVRVYYDPAKPHAEGRLLFPLSGQVIGDYPTLEAEVCAPGPYPVTQVDFLGWYEDFDWEGNGRFQDWHFSYRYGVMTRYPGMATSFPWCMHWETTWLPDQAEPMKLMARFVDASGLCSISPLVEPVVLERKHRSVKMYRPSDVPENFGSRVGKKKQCKIVVDNTLDQAHSAYLVLSTWSAAHDGQISLNDHILVPRIGLVHDVSFDRIPVPIDVIRQGENVFSILSYTDEHAAEVNWPGPVLMIQYNKSLPGLSEGL